MQNLTKPRFRLLIRERIENHDIHKYLLYIVYNIIEESEKTGEVHRRHVDDDRSSVKSLR